MGEVVTGGSKVSVYYNWHPLYFDMIIFERWNYTC